MKTEVCPTGFAKTFGKEVRESAFKTEYVFTAFEMLQEGVATGSPSRG